MELADASVPKRAVAAPAMATRMKGRRLLNSREVQRLDQVYLGALPCRRLHTGGMSRWQCIFTCLKLPELLSLSVAA